MSTATLKDLNAVLNAREASRVSYTISPATGIETLARSFRVNHDRYQESAVHLKQYTDAKNCNPTTPVETEYVTDPDVGRASSFTGKWVHSGCSQVQESDLLVQYLTRVYDITTNAELWAREALPTYDNEILNLFGLQEAEGDAVAFVIYALTKESRAFCMAISDSDLQSNLAGAGWTYANRRFEVDPETNSARFIVACRKVANNSFSVGSPDLEWYQYKTTKQERKHQLWILVDNDDALTGLYTGDSGYNVTDVTISEAEGGSLRIHRTQLLEAYGAVDDAYDEERTEVLNPHGIQSGTKYHVTVKNHHLKSLATAYGTIHSSHTGYTLVDTAEEEEGNGLYTKIYKYEKVSWQAWGHDSYAADETAYGNATSDREQITKVWKGIQLSDLATAVSDCRTGTNVTPESGHIVTEVRVTESQEGSFQISQTQVKQVNAEQNDHDELMQPHALQSGVLDRTTILYDSFHEATLPNPANYVPGTDAGVISNVKDGPDGNGLWRRTIVTETVTWVVWANAAADTVDYDNEGTVAEVKTSTWFGIRNADKATAVAALIDGGAVGADSGYTVDVVRVNDNKNGSLTLTQVQRKMVKGSLGSEIEEDQQTKINPFGIPTAGTRDRVRIINSGLDSPSSAYVTLAVAKTGYTLVDTNEQLQGGLWSVTHIYEKMEWNAFSSDVTSYDTQDVGNPDRENETRTKTWDHIQKADLATAVAYLDSTADDGYYVHRLVVTDNRNGSIRLTQTTGKAVNAATAGKVEGINSHSLRKGLLNETTTIYRDFDEGDLPAGTDPTTANTYVLNEKKGPDGKGFYSRINVLQTTTWHAWGHDAGVPDLTNYQKAETSKENRVRVWFGIQKADLSTIEGSISGWTGHLAPDANYEARNLTIRDNQNGSLTITQDMSYQNASGDTTTDGTERTNAHEMDSADVLSTVTTSTVSYENFASGDLPAGTAITVGGNIISNVKRMQADGLYRRDVVTQTVSTDGSWTDHKYLIGERSGDGQAKSQTHIATGIPLTGLVAAFAAVAAESGYVIAAKSLRYEGHGKFAFVRVQQNTEAGTTEGDAVVISLTAGGTITREWYRRTATAMTTLTTAAGAAISNITYDANVYTHSSFTVTDHHDGSYTVRQVGSRQTTGYYTDSNTTFATVQTRTKNGLEQYRVVTMVRYVNIRGSYDDCIQAQDAETSGTKKIIRPGTPQRFGEGLWSITCDTLDPASAYGSWTTIT